MADEALLKLAIRALGDPDALPVLGDLILESGWDDQRAWSLITRAEPYKVDPLYEGYIQKRWRTEAVSRPTPKLARSVVAVLLFGDWPTRWPLAVENARESRVDRERFWNTPAGAFARLQEQVRRLQDLQSMGAITDEQVRQYINEELRRLG